jgi:hypothetical protein
MTKVTTRPNDTLYLGDVSETSNSIVEIGP